MTAPLVGLRLVAVMGVIAAVLDPGCARQRRPILDVTFAGAIEDAERRRELARLIDAAPWADVVEPRTAVYAPDRADAARVVAGDPGPVLEALRRRPAVLAWQVASPALAVTSVRAPARIVAGARTDIQVTVDGLPDGPGRLRVDVSDATTGVAHARIEVDARDRDAGSTATVAVPWLATRPGPQTLRVVASHEGKTSVRPSPPGDVVVDVRPAVVEVSVLEARPTWAARFARLALADVEGIRVRSEVRVAPGVAVRTAPPEVSGPGGAAQADVILVGGLEALTADDVSRLERDVRERGRAVVLLMDEAPGGGPWRRLWPGGAGPIRSASKPLAGRVAGHVWRMREWLAVPLSTGVVPLAYLDSDDRPFVLGRALGAGRVVLVTALDAWRWRAEPDVAFAAGWRALVQRLGVDVPPPVAVTAWVAGSGRARTLQVEATLRADLATDRNVVVEAEAGAPSRSVPLWQVDADRWRGALRVEEPSPVRLRVGVRSGGQLVGEDQAVVDVSAPRLAASWEDVARHQDDRGALAAGLTDNGLGLTRLRATLETPASARWHVTRTWWWAGLVLTGLGAEWLLRRLRGAR